MGSLVDFFDQPRWIDALIYGSPKSGKTLLAGSLAEGMKVIWVDIENGVHTLRQLPKEWLANITLISIPDIRTNPAAATTVVEMLKGAEGYVCNQHGRWKCASCKEPSQHQVVNLGAMEADSVVVFDGMTQYATSVMNAITSGKPVSYVPNWEDYRKQGLDIANMLAIWKQSKFNRVAISHETFTETEDGKRIYAAAIGTDKFAPFVAGTFNNVIYMDKRNDKFIGGSTANFKMGSQAGSREGFELEKDTSKYQSLLPLFGRTSKRK
jgi:hypothetical protein